MGYLITKTPKNMAILVDNPPNSPWCHMVSDESEQELHNFAKQIGVRREWFQGNHYDLSPGKRLVAVRSGAREVGSRELVQRNCMRRKQ